TQAKVSWAAPTGRRREIKFPESRQMITTYCLMWLGQASGRPTDPKRWEVRCPVHGLHRVDQKTEPITCKIKVQLSPRCVRQCWKRLTSAVQVRQKESTKAR